MKKLNIQQPSKVIDKESFIENADFSTRPSKEAKKTRSKKPSKNTMDRRKKEIGFSIRQELLEVLQNEAKRFDIGFSQLIRLIIFDNLKISAKKSSYYVGRAVRKGILLTDSEYSKLFKAKGSSYASERILKILKEKIEWVD